MQMENLVYKHEKPLFVILALISIIFWGLLILGTLGIALIYLLFFYVFFLFAHSALISFIKGTGVKLSQDQFPDVYEQLEKCCEKLQIKTIPDTYILHADGVLNAFATRFLNRHFVVLFSDIVDALKDNPAAMSFYIGHELGHIHRKHLIWGPILFPGAILPLIGAGYSRAREYTCDNYGFECCEDPKHALAGLVVLAAGPNRWKKIKIQKYVEQTVDTAGFWMSYNELISDYPWLVKRTARILEKTTGNPVRIPGRHWFAWVLACFTPRTMAGAGAGSILIIVAVIGILAAIAIPQFQAYRNRAMANAMMDQMDNYDYEESATNEETGPASQDASTQDLIAVIQEVYNLQAAYQEAQGNFALDLNTIGYKKSIPHVTVNMLDADEECYSAMAVDSRSGQALYFGCEGLR